MIRKLKEVFGKVRHVEPGDMVHIVYDQVCDDGSEVSETIVSQEIDKPMDVDKWGIIEIENEFGLKRGMGGYFGESE